MAPRLLGGLLLWAASVVVTFGTANANLVPTVILAWRFACRGLSTTSPNLVLSRPPPPSAGGTVSAA